MSDLITRLRTACSPESPLGKLCSEAADKLTSVSASNTTSIALTYTNWRGETGERTIIPKRIWFGSTEWHPEPQWLLTAFDVEKNAERDFALKDFGARVLTMADFPSSGNEEAEWIESARDLNCPRCGGSGHVDDGVEAVVDSDIHQFISEMQDQYETRLYQIKKSRHIWRTIAMYAGSTLLIVVLDSAFAWRLV